MKVHEQVAPVSVMPDVTNEPRGHDFADPERKHAGSPGGRLVQRAEVERLAAVGHRKNIHEMRSCVHTLLGQARAKLGARRRRPRARSDALAAEKKVHVRRRQSMPVLSRCLPVLVGFLLAGCTGHIGDSGTVTAMASSTTSATTARRKPPVRSRPTASTASAPPGSVG